MPKKFTKEDRPQGFEPRVLTGGKNLAIMKNIELPPETNEIRSMSDMTRQLISDAIDKIMSIYEVRLDKLITEPIYKEDGKQLKKQFHFSFSHAVVRTGNLLNVS